MHTGNIFPSFPHNAAQRSIVSESISYLTLNLTHADTAFKAYDRALSDCVKYFSGNSTLTRESLQLSLDSAIAQVVSADAFIAPIDSSLSTRLDGTPISKGDITMQETSIRTVLFDMYNQLHHLSSFLIDDATLLPSTKLTYVEAVH